MATTNSKSTAAKKTVFAELGLKGTIEELTKEIQELYLADDLHFKQDFKRVGDSLPQVVRFVLQHTGLKAGLAERCKSVLNIFKDAGLRSPFDPATMRDLMDYAANALGVAEVEAVA